MNAYSSFPSKPKPHLWESFHTSSRLDQVAHVSDSHSPPSFPLLLTSQSVIIFYEPDHLDACLLHYPVYSARLRTLSVLQVATYFLHLADT